MLPSVLDNFSEILANTLSHFSGTYTFLTVIELLSSLKGALIIMTQASRTPIGIDEYSLATIPMTMRFGQTNLSTGTSFIWRHGDDDYLITNWHNVSGKNPRTGEHLSKTLAEPDRVHVLLHDLKSLGRRRPAEIFLNRADGSPVWYEHPVHRKKVDVVAIPLKGKVKQNVLPINEMDSINLNFQIADDVFILGYPLGIDVHNLPIWKKASVASEPNVPIDELPQFYIDTASRPGMSGSPIIKRTRGNAQLDDGSIAIVAGGSMTGTRFVGIYSGRITSIDSLDEQLGIAWHSSVISEIVSAKIEGSRD